MFNMRFMIQSIDRNQQQISQVLVRGKVSGQDHEYLPILNYGVHMVSEYLAQWHCEQYVKVKGLSAITVQTVV